MKCLFSYANEYVKESDWKDLAPVSYTHLSPGCV